MVAPGSTATWYQSAAFVPWCSGLTVAAPATTWSLIPSFGYGGLVSEPYSRASFVSFSQKSAVGAVPSGPGPASSSRSPRNGWSMAMAASSRSQRRGLAASTSQLHVLRNQAVGRTCSVSVSGPALVIWTVINRSVGLALA